MNNDRNIFGCFVCSSLTADATQIQKDKAEKQGHLFRQYIWGERGICDVLRKLNNDDYGKDLMLALFEFYVNPIVYQLENLKEIENYKKNEKSIGIPIIVNDENFFSKSEEGRYNFLRQAILQKLNLLTDVIKKRKLDTAIRKLNSDVVTILELIH